MSVQVVVLLCATSAGFYVAAGVAMKLAADLPFGLVLLPVLALVAIAVRLESLALDGGRFGLVALFILAFEVVLIFGLALVLGERYGVKEFLGLLMVVAGIAVLQQSESGRHPPSGVALAASPVETGPR